MKRFFILFLVLVSISFNACRNKLIRGSGHFVDETRTPAGAFSKLKLGANFEVTVVKDSVYFIELHGEDNILPEVVNDVINGELVLRFRKDNVRIDFQQIRVKVHSPMISDITLQSSGNIIALDTFTTNNVTATISGSGNLTAKWAAKNTISKVQGSGNLTLIGSSDNQEVYISGSGEANTQDFLVKTCFVDISGSGSAKVDVSEWLDVNISGSGNVMYRQKAASPLRNVKITGSGNVTAF